jgi:hypothetical protein
MHPTTKLRIRSHIFRFWTALAVLAGYIFAWLDAPELLTWWKRSTTEAIEAFCAVIPYPWGDQIEATVGDIGLWVQITIAIIAFRIVMWALGLLLWRSWTR